MVLETRILCNMLGTCLLLLLLSCRASNHINDMSTNNRYLQDYTSYDVLIMESYIDYVSKRTIIYIDPKIRHSLKAYEDNILSGIELLGLKIDKITCTERQSNFTCVVDIEDRTYEFSESENSIMQTDRLVTTLRKIADDFELPFIPVWCSQVASGDEDELITVDRKDLDSLFSAGFPYILEDPYNLQDFPKTDQFQSIIVTIKNTLDLEAAMAHFHNEIIPLYNSMDVKLYGNKVKLLSITGTNLLRLCTNDHFDDGIVHSGNIIEISGKQRSALFLKSLLLTHKASVRVQYIQEDRFEDFSGPEFLKFFK